MKPGSPLNVVVTAADPAGPWSAPRWIDPDGYDPSLFFDDDGTCYLTKAGSDASGRRGIVQCRCDPDRGERLEPYRMVWGGSGGFGVEGPHLYRICAWYYLLCAEGATHVGHMVTIARARHPHGPFVGCPRNPILTHRNELGRTILATGHGDLVDSHDGSWRLVCLGIRSHGSQCMAQHVLGRETFLAPVRRRADDQDLVAAEVQVEGTPLLLEAWCNPWALGHAFAVEDDAPPAWRRLTKATTRTLTTEFGGGFTGRMLGAYALGGAIADIDWIEYGPCERMP